MVISVSDYSNNIQSLNFCQNDGNEIYKVLESLGYEIPFNHKLVGQVNYETMKDAIYDFFTDSNTKAEDTLVFYYSGHGIPDVNRDVFLASSEINPDAPFRKGFSFHELTKTIERSNSQRIVTILDCCYSGVAKIGKGNEEDGAELGTAVIDDESKKLPPGICLLAANHGYQEAYWLQEKGQSIFTYYLLKGLKGTSNSVDINNNITPHSLSSYIYNELMNLPKRPKQIPIKVEAGEDIILAHYPTLAVKKDQADSRCANPNDIDEDVRDRGISIHAGGDVIGVNVTGYKNIIGKDMNVSSSKLDSQIIEKFPDVTFPENVSLNECYARAYY